jgi:hypothetical protein
MSVTCNQLHQVLRERETLRFPFDTKLVPENGIYVLYEQDEAGHGGDRIVRVGTHTGDKQLRSRLKQHFINENKDRSIFRKNIGRALLCRDRDQFLEFWNLDLTTVAAKAKHHETFDTSRQKAIELRVTEYIQTRFRFVVLSVPKKDDRLELEARMIATVFSCRVCTPSDQWLGLFSPKAKIHEGGLWQVNELGGEALSERHFQYLKK